VVSWSEDMWSEVVLAAPELNVKKRFRLSVESLLLVMKNPSLDVADDPEGLYPSYSLQTTVRRWHQDGTLRRLIIAFEALELSKEWPSKLPKSALTNSRIGLRELIIRTLLEIRTPPLAKERPELIRRNEDEWKSVFSTLPELKDTERTRLVLDSLDAFMRDPDCRWRDLEEKSSNQINSAINDWERRGLLSVIVRELTYQGLTSSWSNIASPAEKRNRSSIRDTIIQHLRKARKLAAARERPGEREPVKEAFHLEVAGKDFEAENEKSTVEVGEGSNSSQCGRSRSTPRGANRSRSGTTHGSGHGNLAGSQGIKEVEVN
jgi:hypothetical protein